MLDPADPAHARAEERLRTDVVAWITTVSPEGQPQSSPVWFLWDGETLLVYSRPRMPKVRNLRANPRVGIHLRTDEAGEEAVIIEGSAELADDQPPAHEEAPYVDKYATHMEGIGYSPKEFAAAYSQPIRITPSRIRAW